MFAHLRANGFKTSIVSGGGIAFMRPWSAVVCGVPPGQVVGSSAKTRFEMRDDGLVLVRLRDAGFIDDKEVRPVGIDPHIGRRPDAEFGNSGGDLQMLQWAMVGRGARFGLLVHHTDGEHEWAYGKDSAIFYPQRSEAGRRGRADRPGSGRVSAPDACQRRPAATTAVG